MLLLVFGVAEGPLGEEPGWRGFALPRLEQQSGPLIGTLFLGLLWGVWHLPLFFIPGADQNTISIVSNGFFGHLITVAVFAIWTVALAIIITWVFNNTRGGLLLPIFLHASINAAFGSLIPMLFPSLPLTPLLLEDWMLVWIIVALVVTVTTKGTLSYRRYQRTTTKASGMATDRIII